MLHDTIKTEAVIIGERELGEDDKLFFLYSKNFGKIEVLGKAIRKSKAKLKGGLQPLNKIFLEFIRGKNFNIATDAIIKQEFLKIKKNFKKFRTAVYLCDFLNRFLQGEEKENRIWNIFLATLSDLQAIEENKYWLPVRYFEWNLMSFLGFEPEIYYCTKCEKKIKEGKIFFSKNNGGLICEECFRENKQDKLISRSIIKILRLIINQDKKTFYRLKLTKEIEDELRLVSNDYFQYVLQEKIFVI